MSTLQTAEKPTLATPVAAPATIKITVRLGPDRIIRRRIPEGSRVCDLVQDLRLPDDLKLVIVNHDYRQKLGLGSERVLEDGASLHFTTLVPIQIELPNGMLALTKQLPVLGLPLNLLPAIAQHLTGTRLELDVVKIDGIRTSGDLNKQVVERERTYRVIDP